MDWLRRLTGGKREDERPPAVAPSRPASPTGSSPASAFRRTAYLPIAAAEPFGVGSGFGGQPYLAPGVENPVCPQCGEPMPLIAQVALDAQPAPVITGEGLLQLFYCTRERDDNPCDTMLEGWAPFSDGHVARLVPATPGGTSPDLDTPFEPQRVTGWTPADDYPGWEELRELGGDAGDPPDEAEPFPLEGEKLGGWPAWVQGIEYPTCPRCGERMQLVLQVDSEKLIDTMWGDMGIGHVTQCPNDPDVLTFAWACS